MSENLINSKIELLEDQIANLEQSGFFTEKEIDKLSGPLRLELDTLRNSELYTSLKRVWDRSSSLIDKEKLYTDPEAKFIVTSNYKGE